ncbi:MAG: cell division protein FtsW [Eubacterium sp.]|jgi:cell division protein FtsW|nr:cell division protein FtsW [Eubacterium sp.]
MGRRPKAKKNGEKQIKYFDYTLLFIIIFLVGFGLVMLYSTSSYNAQLKFDDTAFYLKKQLSASLLGFAGMFVVANVDYHIWLRLSGLIYIVSIALCTAVIFMGTNLNGSTRWLKLGPLSFQPSEVAKMAVILFLATVISRIPAQMGKFVTVVKIMLIVLPVLGLVGVSNLSTAIIILGISVCLIFVASPKYRHFIIMAAFVILFGIIFIKQAGYRTERILIWLNPEEYDKGYQTLQGLYAIGSGGLFGKGLGESMQKLGFLPEAQNDMIFSIICEELGLFGAICVILLFLLLIWRFLVIANNAPDLFGALIVVGIMAHISIQVILNIAVVTNSIPNTGVTLPFISYGGTSVAILLTEMGFALSVSRGIKLEMI